MVPLTDLTPVLDETHAAVLGMLPLDLLGPLSVVDDDGNDVTPTSQREKEGLVMLAIVAPTSLSVDWPTRSRLSTMARPNGVSS